MKVTFVAQLGVRALRVIGLAGVVREGHVPRASNYRSGVETRLVSRWCERHPGHLAVSKVSLLMGCGGVLIIVHPHNARKSSLLDFTAAASGNYF